MPLAKKSSAASGTAAKVASARGRAIRAPAAPAACDDCLKHGSPFSSRGRAASSRRAVGEASSGAASGSLSTKDNMLASDARLEAGEPVKALYTTHACAVAAVVAAAAAVCALIPLPCTHGFACDQMERNWLRVWMCACECCIAARG